MNAQLVPDVPEADVEVAVVAWPAREPERRALAAAGDPRILVVSPTGPPPVVADELEDWVREPVDLVELAMRTATLRARHRARRDAARLEPGGILRHCGQWISVSPAQVPLVQLLLAEFGHVVHTAELRGVHAEGGGVDDDLAVAAVLRRLAPALAAVGLDLHRLRDRGYLLDRAGAPGRPPPLGAVAALPSRRHPAPSGRQTISDSASVRLAWARTRAADR